MPYPVHSSRRARLVRAAAIAALLAGIAACTPPQVPPGAAQANEDAISAAAWQIARNHETNGDYQNALQQYTHLARSAPEDPRPILGQARTLRYAGSPDLAVTLLEKAIERLGPTPALRLELAKAHLAFGERGKALELLDALAEETPDDWRIYSARGIALDREGRAADAQAAFRHALDLSPDEPEALNNLALSLAMNGDLDAGIALLDQAARRTDAPMHLRQNLALLYALRGDMARAEAITRDNLPPDAAEEAVASLQRIAAQTTAPRYPTPE